MEKLTEIVSNRVSKEDLEYLEQHNISPSKYMHPKIKKDRELTKKNTKQDNIQTHSKNMIMIGFGVFFIFYSFSTSVLVFLISFPLGLLFIIIGLLDILMDIMKKIKVDKEIGRRKTE